MHTSHSAKCYSCNTRASLSGVPSKYWLRSTLLNFDSVPQLFQLIIIIIIKICSTHISSLLGAQGAETKKTWIQTIYSDSKNKIMYRDTCTMQLQIYIIFEKLWHKMSFKQRLKSSYTMTRFEFSWKMIPESRSRDTEKDLSPQVCFEVGSCRSDMLLECKLREGAMLLTDLWTISISLKTILCETGSQCSSFKIGVIWRDFLDKVTTRAAVFCICWRRDIWFCGRP